MSSLVKLKIENEEKEKKWIREKKEFYQAACIAVEEEAKKDSIIQRITKGNVHDTKKVWSASK